jgi:hypothetical protein
VDHIAQLRQALARVVRLQRRIWLLQATFWSVITLGCIAVVAAVVRETRRRRDAGAVLNDVPPAPPNRATGPPAALNNGDVSAAAE